MCPIRNQGKPGRASATSSVRAEFLAAGILSILVLQACLNHLDFSLGARFVSGCDLGMHLTKAFLIDRDLFHWSKILSVSSSPMFEDFQHGPMTYVFSSVVRRILRVGPLAAIYAAKALWIVVVSVSLYGAGRRLGGGPWAGLAAAGIGAASPVPLAAAREVSAEFPLYAATAVGFYGYALSRGFATRSSSALAGCCFGFGLLVKPTPVAFWLPFLGIALALPLFEGTSSRKQRFRNLLACGFTASLIVAPYYLPLARTIFAQNTLVGSFDLESYFGRARWYAGAFGDLFSPFLIAAGVAALVAAIHARDRYVVSLIAAGISGFAFVCSIRNLTITYLYPFLALHALLVARAIGRTPLAWKKFAALALVALYGWPLFRPFDAAAFPQPSVARFATRVAYGRIPWTPPINALRWDPVAQLSEVFAARYSRFTSHEVGIVSPAAYHDVLIAALSLADPGDTWGQRPYWEGFCVPVHRDCFASLGKLPLIIAVLPSDLKVPPTREEEWAIAIVEEFRKNRTVDFELRTSVYLDTGIDSTHRILFLLSRGG